MFRAFFLVSLFLVSHQAGAEIFKCTSPDGTVAFQEKPCDGVGTETKVKIKSEPGETANPECVHDILGMWKSTHISMEPDKDLMADTSNKWLFKSNKKVTHFGFIEQEIPYECIGDTITLHALVKSNLKIIKHENNRMVWHSVDFGGYIHVSR